MPVLGFAADKCFVHFHDTDQFAEIFVAHTDAEPMAHIPSGFVGAEAHSPVDLQGADALLAGQHHVQNAKPVAERLVGILENRAADMTETVGRRNATLIALPMPRHRAVLADVRSAATGTFDAIRPAVADKVGATRILGGERLFPLTYGHLMNVLTSHIGPHSMMEAECHAQ